MSGKDRILVVDDEEPVLIVVEAMLSDEYEVETASNGEEALEKCRRSRFTAALLDIALPGAYSGFELVKEMRQLYPDMKIVLMTGLGLDRKRRDKALETADRLLTKPFDVDEIKAVLHDLLHQPV